MVNTRDISWMAGFLEGEGWFGERTNKQQNGKYVYRHPIISVSGTDLDVIQKAAELFGKAVNGPYMAKKSTKPYWMTQITGKAAIGWMLTLYPILGSRRQAKIREIVTKFKD